MSVNNISETQRKMNSVERKLMYKSHGQWAVKTTGTIALGALAAVAGAGNVTAHADTVSPVATQSTPAVNETVSTSTQDRQATTVAPVVTQANNTVNQAVTTSRPSIVAGGGSIESMSPQVVNQSNVANVTTEAQNQAANINAVASADSAMMSAITSGASATSAMGGSYIPQSAQDATGWNQQQIDSVTSKTVANLDAVGNGNSLQLSAASANGQNISNASGVMKPGSTMDVSSLSPEEIASITSRAAAILSATGSADIQLTSASQTYTSAINAVGGQLKRSESINTADGMTVDQITSMVKSQIVGISQTASADAVIRSVVQSALPGVNNIGGIMSAGSTIDATTLDPASLASMVSHQQAMVSATASGDIAISDVVNVNKGNINAAGGTITVGSHVNTADNMTVDQIMHLVESQIANVSATGSVDGMLAPLISEVQSAASQAGITLKSGQNIDVSSMTPEEIQSLGQSLVNNYKNVAGHDEMINSAVPAVSGVVTSAGGKMTPGSVIDATNWTPEQIASETKQQSEMISATGSADADVKSNVDSATPDINGAGGHITQSGAVNTANNMTVSEVASHVASQDAKISETVSADRVIGKVVSDNAGVISNAGGVEKPGKEIDTTGLTSDQINSMVAHQQAMVSATGSADADVKSNVDSATGDITKAGGSITQSGTVNTADNWTVSEIANHVASQDAKISETASADRGIDKVVNDNSKAISNANGIEKPGSSIDTTNLTSEQINSMVAYQQAMVSATGSADTAIKNHADSVSSVINGAGGTITQFGTINTADNWTPEEIASHERAQEQRIDAVVSADAGISKAVVDNASAISAVSGVEKPGKAIDATDMTPEQINSMVANQEAMVSATGSADADVKSNVDSAIGDVTNVGGTIKQSGTVNTADNMTVSQVASHVASQDAKISETASADRVINKVVNDNSQAISNANGIEKPGSAIDTTNLTSEQINSMVAHQEAMVSATGSADAAVKSHADNAASTIIGAGGTITQSGTINTADNWTPEEIASHEHAQEQRIDAVKNADAGIAKVVSDNANAISAVSGVEKSGKAIDATSMTPEQINSMVAHQEAMVSATGSADADIKSNVDSATGDITNVGGTITQSGTVNTADNMTVSEVASHVLSQDAKISETASADRGIHKVVTDNASAISAASGVEKPGSAIDTTNLTSDQINSMVSHQEAMVSATGSADAAVKSHADNAVSIINGAGGTITQSGTVNTADNWTVDQVASHEKAQEQRIDAVKNADSGISKVVADNSQAISAVNGVEKPGKAIDATSMTPEQINSMVAHQEAMVSATGSADVQIKSDVDSAAGDITTAGGTINQSGTVNTADNMTVSEIASHVTSQGAKISETASADRGIYKVVTDNASAISAANGVEKPGSAIDTTSLTSEQINSMVAHQEAMVSATGSADADVKSNVDSVTNDITKIGGHITQSGTINTADNMTVDQIKSNVVSQDAKIDATASADRGIASVVVKNSGAIAAISGIEKAGSELDTTSMTLSDVASIVAHQEAMVNATGSADSELLSLVNSVSNAINMNHGFVTPSGSVNTADNITVEQIQSAVKAQMDCINAVNNADTSLADMLKNGSDAIFGSKIKAGSAVDVTAKNPEQIKALADSQAAMISQTIANNVLLSNAESVAKSAVAAVGGKLAKGSNIDVTGKTVSEIASLASQQASVLSAVQTVDDSLASALTKSNEVAKAGGTITRGADINAASMTASDIIADGEKQAANVAATVSGDAIINNALTHVWSQTVTRGSAIDVSSMTPEQIASLTASEADAIGETQNANEQLSEAVARTSQSIHEIGGKTITVPIKQTEGLTSEQIGLSAASQTGKLDETATANDLASSAIAAHRGVVMSSVTAVNTTNMDSQAIVSEVHSQANHIAHTDSMNSNVLSQVAVQNPMVTGAGGQLTKSGLFDTTSMTEDAMTSWTNSELGHLSHVGSNDKVLTDTLNASHANLTLLQGSAVLSVAIDVTNKTDAEIDSLMNSQITLISQAASANVVMDSERASAIAAGVNVSIAQQSLRSKQEIDTLMASTASALTSAVTVASESKAVTKAVDSYNAVMDAFLAQYQQAGGNPLDMKWVEIDAGQDASHVVSQANSLLGSLSIENSKAQASLSVATETMNYIKNEVQGSLSALATEAMQTSGVTYTSDANVQVHSLGDIESDWAIQKANASSVVALQKNANANKAKVDDPETEGWSKVRSAVEAARAVGVNISSTAVVDQGQYDATNDGEVTSMIAKISNDNNNQVAEIQSAIALQKQYDDSYSATSTSIENSYNTAYNNYVTQSNSIATSYNDAMTSYNNASTAISQANQASSDSYAKAMQSYNAKVASINAKFNEANGNDGVGDVAAGQWLNLKPKKLGDLTLAGVGSIRNAADLTNGNFQIMGHTDNGQPIDKSHIVTHIVWGNIAPQLISGSLQPGKTSWTTYDVHGANQVWHVTNGTIIRIPQSLYTMDGKVHDVIVKIESWGNKLHDTDVTIWNQNGAINYVQDGSAATYNTNTIRASYGVDQLVSSEPYYWFNAESDLDVGQRVTTGDGSNIMVQSIGGMVHYDATVGAINVKSTGGSINLKGFDSAPNGIVVYAAYTPTFVKQISDDNSSVAYAIADADFGLSLNLDIPIAPPPSNHQNPPTPPSKQTVIAPTKESVTRQHASVTYHPNKTIPKPGLMTHSVHLHGYYDNDRIQPIKVKNITQVPKMTVTSADPIYAALSSHYPDVKTNYHAYDTNLIQNFNYQYKPMSTQYHVYNDEGGYNPEDYNYSPVGTTYARYDTDGSKIPSTIDDPKNPGHKIPNPKFTGYTPWSTTWKNYSTDGTNIPPMIPDPNNPGKLIPNPKFTGYTPWSTTWQNYSTDGTNIPPMISDPKNPGHLIPNPKFTGYTPWSTTWKNYSTDGTNIPPMIPDPKNLGHLIPNPKFTGYTPWSTTWKNYSTDGTNIPPMIEDPKNPGHLIPNPKFTGYTPWSTTWQSYSTDGTNIPPMIPDPNNPGKLIPNPKFTGYTPWSTTWQNYSTDGTNIPPMIEDPKNPGHYIPNPKFTGYAPWSTTWQSYSTDGTKIPPMIPDPNHPGHLISNPKFTGYTPWSTTWQNYSTDGTNIPPMIPDPKNPGHYIPNPKFTGYTPWSTTWQNYSSDGKAISKDVPSVIPDPNNPGHYIKNPKFTGYAPMTTEKRGLSTTYDVLDSDGSKIPPMIPDPNHPGKYIPNPKFTGYAPFSYTYRPFSDDGSKVPSMIPDGRGGFMPNPNFTGYAPLSTKYTPLSVKYHNYQAAPEALEPAQPAPAPASSVPISVPSVAARVASAPLVTSVPAQSALPQTGRAHSLIALVGLAGLAAASMMSLVGVNKRKHEA